MSKQFNNFIESNGALTVAQLVTFTKPEQERVRQWCMCDVWFSAQHIFRDSKNLPLESCHMEVCYSLVQPNPDEDIHAWSAAKERAILCFRGFGKTTLDIGHCVQIILSAPDVRLLFVGGTVQHAERKMRAVVDIFNTNAVIQHLFPKFYNASVKAGTFTCPARTLNLKEATITCASFRSTNASGHYDWLKLDDAQNDANSGTAAAVEKSMVKFDDLSPLLEPNSYTDFIGVRQDANDIPAQMSTRSSQIGTPLGWIEIPVFTLKERDDVAARYKANRLDLANDVIFAWEAKWNAETLRLPYSKPNFRENYLLEVFEPAEEPAIQSVTPELLYSCLTKSVNLLDEIPVINADLSSISPRGTDCCGIIGGYWNPTTKILTVNRILHQKFTEPSDFLRQMRQFYGDHCMSLNRIRFRTESNRDEEQLFEKDFKQQGMLAEFLPSLGGKYERVATLWEAVRAGVIKFADELSKTPDWQVLVNQMCYFSRTENQHDDAVDSLAQLHLYCQTITAAEPSLNIPDFGDESDVIYPVARSCNTVKIRKPDTIQRPLEYCDPYYARAFSTGFER